MADLQAERDAQLDALGVQRVVAAVAGRQVPQPRHYPQRAEAEGAHTAPQFPHRVHGTGQVDGGDAGEPVRVAGDDRGDLVVGDQQPSRSPPGAQHPGPHACRVHRRQRRLDGNLAGVQLAVGPAAQGIEHRVRQESRGRMLHPGIDDHYVSAHRSLACHTYFAYGSTMPIAITEEHRSLAETTADFLAKRNARDATRALLAADAGAQSPPAFWQELSSLGWLGLHVPEQYGGSGYGLEELAVVAEQMGRVLAPGPFAPTTIASAVLVAAADAGTKENLLPGLADGSVIGAVALDAAVRVRD